MVYIIILVLAIAAIAAWQFFKNKEDIHKDYNIPQETLSSKEKGDLGEITIREKILRELNPNERMLNNYITQGTSSNTSQIDHIVIKPSGVYVIETKNYEGKILGKRDELEWIQVLAAGHVKNKFYNPVKQNYTHIKNIKKYIGENTPIYSMVVFLKGDINEIAWIEEVYTPHRMMLKFEYAENEKVLSDEEIIQIYNNLKDHKEHITDEEHVENVNKFLHHK